MNKNLMLLLSGQFISQVGDKFHMIAISLWILKSTGSSAQMGIVLAASIIPSLILGLFTGAIIDRIDRKTIIVGTDLIRGLILLIFSILFITGNVHLLVVIILQVLLSVCSALFDPTIPSVIPQITNSEYLSYANSKQQMIKGISTIMGSFLSGFLISIFGFSTIFILNLISFILSAFFEGFMKIPAVEMDTVRENTFIGDMKEGYKYILARKNLMVLLLIVLVIHFFSGSSEMFMPVIANSISESGSETLGFFKTAFGIGIISRSFVIDKLKIFGKERQLLFGSILSLGIIYSSTLFLGWNTFPLNIAYSIIFLLYGSCIISAYISFRTLMQKLCNIYEMDLNSQDSHSLRESL